MRAAGADTQGSLGRIAVGAAAVALIALGVVRARYGISFADDSHYAAITLRLAQGAVPIADEMTMQSTGFALAAPFAWAWSQLFGSAGIVLALRLFYVAVASACGAVAYRALVPSFGRVASFAAVSVPLIALPYNIVGPSYNTGAALGFLLATALSLAALRDRSAGAATAGGVALAAGAFCYPPLAIAAAAFAVTFIALARDRGLSLRFLAGAALVALPALAWLLLVVGPDAIARSLAYSRATWATHAGPDARIDRVIWKVGDSVAQRLLVPAWVLGIAAALPLVRDRIRAWAIALLPLAVAAPGLRYLALKRGYTDWFGYTGAAMLTLVVLAGALAVAAHARRADNRDLARALVLAAPASVVGWALVATSTTAAWVYAVPVVALAPLASVVAAGIVLIAARGGGATRMVATAGLIGMLAIALMATSFKDGAPRMLDTTVTSGAFAGIRTTGARAADIGAITALGERYVDADTRVLAVANPAAYLLVGGRMHTNAIWLATGSADAATVAYFERTGVAPDVVFVARSLAEDTGAWDGDPLLTYVRERYRMAPGDGPLVVYQARR